MEHVNIYEQGDYADAYARMAFPGTYHLAFRDLPELIARHVAGKAALDFGCGAGRSSRFLRGLGFRVVGIDISPVMIRNAVELDPEGDYRLVRPGSFEALGEARFDLILAAFPFDNIPMSMKDVLFASFASLLNPGGRVINLVSTPEIYTHEWASFSTKDFPENRAKQSGDIVKVITFTIDAQTVVEDILCTGESYREIYGRAGLRVLESHLPMGREDDPYEWVSETTVAPWRLDVLGQ
ncbi:MAG: class I SAM-dependent methyltransferase [Phycisphaeraceae bacterium]|nr:class I SAM-dependent methyltransferase [Phycisphaeraceae bacterium]MCB9846983.1 class I SAM-dependent methyltransferase [Phycisphaeraceae bacterium]